MMSSLRTNRKPEETPHCGKWRLIAVAKLLILTTRLKLHIKRQSALFIQVITFAVDL